MVEFYSICLWLTSHKYYARYKMLMKSVFPSYVFLFIIRVSAHAFHLVSCAPFLSVCFSSSTIRIVVTHADVADIQVGFLKMVDCDSCQCRGVSVSVIWTGVTDAVE
jgi:hypothetical protein